MTEVQERTRAALPDVSARLAVDLGPLRLANPVLPASGCFGPELAEIIDVGRLAATVTKTVFTAQRSGNPAHRLAETRAGMLNSVGIPSMGLGRWRRDVLPAYQACGVPVVVSVGGLTERDYAAAVEALAGVDVAAIELNVSCPNLEAGGVEIGGDPAALHRVVRDVRGRTPLPLIAKLTPNTADVPELARAAAAGGADAVTVANTFVGMSVDVRHRRPVLGNTVGGLSGPSIKPLALRLVWQTARAVDVPVIGCGGICDVQDAVEFLLAGATAVQVGTATFTRPQTMTEIVTDLPDVLTELGAPSVRDLIGTLQTPSAPRPDPTIPGRKDRP